MINLAPHVIVNTEAIAYFKFTQASGAEWLRVVFKSNPRPCNAIDLLGADARVAWQRLKRCEGQDFVELSDRFMVNVQAIAFCRYEDEGIRIVFHGVDRSDLEIVIEEAQKDAAWQKLQWL